MSNQGRLMSVSIFWLSIAWDSIVASWIYPYIDAPRHQNTGNFGQSRMNIQFRRLKSKIQACWIIFKPCKIWNGSAVGIGIARRAITSLIYSHMFIARRHLVNWNKSDSALWTNVIIENKDHLKPYILMQPDADLFISQNRESLINTDKKFFVFPVLLWRMS